MKHPLFAQLLALELDAADYAVFGSAPLFVHGLKPVLRDLDVVARGAAWARALGLAERGRLVRDTPPSGLGRMLRHPTESIEIFDRWGTDVDVDELIDGAEVVDGIPFVLVGAVVRWKALSLREKDRMDLAATPSDVVLRALADQ